MFTGIVAEVGRVKDLRRVSGGVDIVIEAPKTAARAAAGASVAVNGVCQTVVESSPPAFRVQAVGATVERTTLAHLSAGSRVNLEPSLRIGEELGGHFVTGHVDGIGTVSLLRRRGGGALLEVELPAGLERFAAPRGSIAIDGTSFTVAAAPGARVEISLIPHTLQNTIACDYCVGRAVNVEVDLVARYLDRLLRDGRGGSPGGVTWDRLMEKLS